MSYNLIIKEGYKGGPCSREEINFSTSRTFDTLDQVEQSILDSLEEIQNKYYIIRRWSESSDMSVSYKILFKSGNGHGRLVRTHLIRRNMKHRNIDDDLV